MLVINKMKYYTIIFKIWLHMYIACETDKYR